MTRSLIPPLDELKTIYSEEINNSAVRAISRWNESNHSDACDDEAYLQKALAEGPELLDKLTKAIEAI